MDIIRGIILVIFSTILWGGNYIAGRILAEAMPALFLNGIRWTTSAAELFLILIITGRPLTPLKKWKEFSLLGVIGIFTFSALTYLALKSVPASQAGMIAGMESISMLLLSAVILHKVPKPMQWVGVAFSVIGVFSLIETAERQQYFSVRSGDIELLLAALAWGLYCVLGDKFGNDTDSLTMTTGAIIYGAIPSALSGAYSGLTGTFHMTLTAWLAVVYVCTAASSLAYVVWNLGIGLVGVNGAAPFLNLMPIWTIILGIVLLGEKVTIYQFISGAIILIGMWLAGDHQHKKSLRIDTGLKDTLNLRDF